MSLSWIWILVMTVASISQVYSKYLVLAPKVFRPDSNYSMEISVLGASGNVDVTVDVTANGKSFVSKTESIENDKAKKITLPIGSVPDGSHKLKVTASGGLSFTNSTGLTLKKTTHMILVQLDKAIYKPSQTVRIRILSIDPQDLSLKKLPTSLAIMDERGNKLDEKKDATSDSGVISWDYDLSDQPPLGTWKVIAKNQGGEFTKTFKVDKYVLPRFEVTVTALPSFIVRGMPEIKFQVNAKYTYGKAVQGEYMITVSGRSQKMMVTGTEGSYDFVFKTADLIDEKNANQRYGYNELQVQAEVKETTSDISEKADPLPLKIFTHPIKIAFGEETSKVYRPGLPIVVHIKVTDALGTKPATEYVGKMVLISMTLGSNKRNTKTLPIKNDGTIATEFDIPADTDPNTHISLEAEVEGEKDLKVTHYSMSAFKTLMDGTIEVNFGAASVQPFKVGSQFEIIVETTKVMSHVVYMIISRGEIVDSQQLEMKGQLRKSHLITATRSMAPKAKLILYAVNDNGKQQEVLADSLELDINGIFENSITLQFSKKEKRVGENVEMTVTSDSWSDFFVLAVDQSVLLLETGNDITKQGVRKEIGKFDIEEKEDENNNPKPMPLMRGFGFFPWPNPSFNTEKSAGSLLKARGLLSMTDTDLQQDEQVRYYGDDRMFFKGDFADTAVDEVPSVEGKEMAALGQARTFFPEAWLWIQDKTDAYGKKVRIEKVPDTITTWEATAFSISPKKGLAITDTSTKLTAFKPFFITMTLPYSITRTETFQLRVTVYNYMTMQTVVTVTLAESDEFDLIQSTRTAQTVITGPGVKDVVVYPNVPKAVIFEIKPIKLGDITVKVTARPEKKTGELGDTEVRVVLVKPEGIMNMRTSGLTLDLRDNSDSYNETIYLAFPPADQVVPESRRIEVKVTGDIMGPAITGLGKTLHVPTGCGEQNMIGMTPNIYVAKYLKSVESLTSKIKDKAIKNMKIGYQRELTYMREDGSFSAFGDRDKEGSTWLTAFVIKSFSQARDFLTGDVVIDPKVMHNAFRWLESKQKEGLFRSVGFVCHQELMGGAAKGEALTAFVLIALKDSEYFLQGAGSTSDINNRVQSAITSATQKLEAEVDADSITKEYDIAIVAYALTRVNSDRAAVLLNKINGFKKPWEKSDATTKPIPEDGDVVAFGHHCCGPHRAQPTSVELWSYVLLTHTARKDTANGRLIMKWLSKQQNGNGGFISTQDTVLGLQALSEYAILTKTSGETSIKLTVIAGDAAPQKLTVDQNNKLILQSIVYADSDIKGAIKVSSDIKSVRIVGQGTGLAIVKIDYQYNTKKSSTSPGTDPNFKCEMENIETIQLSTDKAKLSLCVKCSNGIGMTLLSINQPTAFNVVNRKMLEDVKGVKKVEDSNGVLVLYLDEPTVAICPEIHLLRTQPIMNVRPAALKLNSYYNPGVVQDTLYELPKALIGENICQVCAKGECPEDCLGGSGFVPNRLDAIVLVGCICALLSLLLAI